MGMGEWLRSKILKNIAIQCFIEKINMWDTDYNDTMVQEMSIHKNGLCATWDEMVRLTGCKDTGQCWDRQIIDQN